ncbi:MAG: glycosyl hydrolase [Candidatus Borkfalkiaceae bacterium]|nr:glycosyl hydrolase [Christensenellaceae bacterium]
MIETLKRADVNFFRPTPFWSINSDLDAKEIERQIGEMHDYGLGGFVFHARTGLVTEYLSEKWFEMVGVALKTAKKYGMMVWIYDENGWPSGFVGGKLLSTESFRAKYLRYRKGETFDSSADYVYVFEDGKARRVTAPCGAAEYHAVTVETSDSYTDILNPAVTDAFIRETHEKYYERFAPSFGKELVGFFTDEPQYYRAETPFPLVEEEFRAAYGEDVADGLVYLFVQCESGYPFRVKYYSLLNRLYCENFYAKLKKWCDDHGCMLTGHSVEETRLTTQMWGGADCSPSYLFEDIPGIDNLAKENTAEISAKALGSVCSQIGNRLALTETFGVSGYSTTPFEMRAIADKQYVYGVDVMVQHLYNYSFAGQGKIDCPPSFGRMMPWISGYKSFNDYFARLGYLISQSEEEVCVAVVPPMESVYLNYVRLNEERSYREVDDPFDRILLDLRKAGVPYHFVNEKIAEKFARAENGKLVVGKREYSAVVLANCEEIKSSTLALLEEYAAQGGKILVEGRRPAYRDGYPFAFGIESNCTIADLPRPVAVGVSGDVSLSVRRAFGKRFLFLVNGGNEPVRVKTEEICSVVDLVGMKGYAPTKDHVVKPKSSLLLEEKGNYTEKYPVYSSSETLIPTPVSFGENNLTVENVTVTRKDGKKLSGYVYGVFETLAKSGYEGEIKAEFVFGSDGERKVKLTVEKKPSRNVKFNGEPVFFRQSSLDVNFEEAFVTAKEGENVFSYEVDFSAEKVGSDILYGKGVPESILNMTTYDILIDPIYVGGDFETEGFRIVSPTERKAGDLTERGYGNFAGSVVYTLRPEKREGPVFIRPLGKYSQCVVRADGKEYRVLLDDGVTVDGLSGGTVEIECFSTLRNKFGPFHFIGEKDDCIGPDTFTLRNLWQDEKTNPLYSEKRRLVPFGLDGVEILF